MAERPWILPAELRKYSEYESVKGRPAEKLAVDIGRAEEYVVRYTGNGFEEGELPRAVRTAALLLAEAHAYNAAMPATRITGERFDDYSYTAENKSLEIGGPEVLALLKDYVLTGQKGLDIRLRSV